MGAASVRQQPLCSLGNLLIPLPSCATSFGGVVRDGAITKATGSSTPGDCSGSQALETSAASIAPRVTNVSYRSPGFGADSVSYRPLHDLTRLGPLLSLGASAAQFLLAIALVWIAAIESSARFTELTGCPHPLLVVQHFLLPLLISDAATNHPDDEKDDA